LPDAGRKEVDADGPPNVEWPGNTVTSGTVMNPTVAGTRERFTPDERTFEQMSKERLMRAVACAGLSLVAAVLIAGRFERRSSAAPQSEKTAEQEFKNIKVLKGLPASQLFPLMQFFTVSLGTKCDYCHVGRDAKGEFHWESDDKPEKNTARQMMQMVIALNHSQGYGLDPGAVSCYTCHLGHTRPTSLPTLPLPEPTPTASATPATPRPRETPPTVQQIYDKYVAAVGGAEAASKFQTIVFKGTRGSAQGQWPFEATLQGPDKFVMVTQVPKQGTFISGLNGANGWVSNPSLTRALSPSELKDAEHMAEGFRLIKFTPTATMRSVGRRKVGDLDAYIVIDRPSEGVSRRYFFDAQTGLLRRIMTLTQTMLSPLLEQADFDDYRDVDGVKIPFVFRISTVDANGSTTRTVAEVRHGVPVEDKVFVMPPAAATAPKP